MLLTRSPLEYPRRAFPLDLHVLSTPPAFVLSQDQTLQQKPVEKQSQQQTILLPKESPTQPKKASRANHIGTGLSSTLLSSQRTTTHRKPTAYLRRPALGALVQLYCVVPGLVNRFLPVRTVLTQYVPSTRARSSRCELEGRRTWQDGRCGLEPRARPFPCRRRTLPACSCQPPNRPPVSLITAGQRRATLGLGDLDDAGRDPRTQQRLVVRRRPVHHDAVHEPERAAVPGAHHAGVGARSRRPRPRPADRSRASSARSSRSPWSPVAVEQDRHVVDLAHRRLAVRQRGQRRRPRSTPRASGRCPATPGSCRRPGRTRGGRPGRRPRPAIDRPAKASALPRAVGPESRRFSEPR